MRTTDNFCSDHCRKLYKGEARGKRPKIKSSGFSVPNRKEWKIEVGKGKFKQIFLYEPWDGKYYQYKLGSGLVNDIDRIIAEEGTPYFNLLIKVCTNSRSRVPPNISKPVMLKEKQRLPKHKVVNIKLPKDVYQCVNCGNLIRLIMKPTNFLLCPACNTDFRHKLSEEVFIRKVKQEEKEGLIGGNTNIIPKLKRI